ncbi:MAG: MATE family efflux transporter [Pseudomonadota bacterium]
MLTIRETKILISLAIPLILSGLVEASLGFTSTLFLAHVGARALAAGALVGWFFAALMIVLWGMFTAISVFIANQQGANDEAAIAYVIRDGVWIAIALTIPTTIVIWYMAPLLLWLGQKQALVDLATPYLHGLAFSILPDFIGLVLLQLVIGLGHTRTNLVFTLSWVGLNIGLNFLLVFGYLDFPRLGIAGLGWGTTITFWVSTIAWLIYLLSRKLYQPYFKKIFTFEKPYFFKDIFKVGFPVGLMYSIEVSFFFIMLLLIGHMSTDMLAASQVTMQYLGLFVAILFATAQAVTVRVSNRLGAKEIDVINHTIRSALAIVLAIMSALAIIIWLFPDYFIALDFQTNVSKNAVVVKSARMFLSIGMMFLLFEAVRIVLFGALRGLKDTKSTLLGSLISFWLTAIPSGYFFAFHLDYGAAGYWLGLLFSGFVGVAFLLWRLKVAMQKIRGLNLSDDLKVYST